MAVGKEEKRFSPGMPILLGESKHISFFKVVVYQRRREKKRKEKKRKRKGR